MTTMFEEFSYKYESSFRSFFIVWVLIWSIINGFRTLLNYAEFAVNGIGDSGVSTDLVVWWFTTVGQVIGLAVGVVLIFWMSSVSNRVAKRKKVSSLGIFTGLAVVYYLFGTFVNIFASAIVATPAELASDLIFASAWLLPSVIILIFHILYFINLGKHNEEIESNPQGVPSA